MHNLAYCESGTNSVCVCVCVCVFVCVCLCVRARACGVCVIVWAMYSISKLDKVTSLPQGLCQMQEFPVVLHWAGQHPGTYV